MSADLFGLDSTQGLWSNASNWETEPLTEAKLLELAEVLRRPPPEDPIYVPAATWARMEAVKREFPKATDMQCLEAACFAKDDADAIRQFAVWYASRPRRI